MLPVKGPAPEILAPAGTEESVRAAIAAGADAVYLGAKSLNARRGAGNFTDEELCRTVSLAHQYGVRVLLTVNTIVFDSELEELDRLIRLACDAAVDGVILQDLAVWEYLRTRTRGLPMHASTQMAVHNLEGARQLEEMGFARAVLARELSLEEIARIRAGTSLELECFIHGALCFCLSGQCYLSAMIGGRSGNRGMCAQPCRLPFSGGVNSHSLSLKDLCAAALLPQLARIGVNSVKIEGRMKRAEYVAAAVEACRLAREGKPFDLEKLRAVFSRSGFTNGYLEGRVGREMFGTRQKEDVTAAAGVLGQLRQIYARLPGRVPVELSFTAQPGEPLALSARDADGFAAAAAGEVPQPALHQPATAQRLLPNLQKTGGTPFVAERVEIQLGEGLAVPLSAVNGLRRTVLEDLAAQRGSRRVGEYLPRQQEPLAGLAQQPGAPLIVCALAGQATDFVAASARWVALPPAECAKVTGRIPAEKLAVSLPPVDFSDGTALERQLLRLREAGVGLALCRNIGQIRLARRLGFAAWGEYNLNIANSVALEQYRRLGLVGATLPFEIELDRLAALQKPFDCGLLVYGYLPLMTYRACPVRLSKGCGACREQGAWLSDRLGNRFRASCRLGGPQLYNSLPLYAGDLRRDLPFAVPELLFTFEEPAQCDQVLRLFLAGEKFPGKRTHGMYLRRLL